MDQSLNKFFYNKTIELNYSLATRTLQFTTDFGLLQDTKHYNLFPYKDSDSLSFNLKDNSGQYEYEGQFYELTNDDKDILREWILEYYKDDDNRVDIYVPCYSPEDNNLYIGDFLISQMKELNYKMAETACGYPVGRYNENTDTWEKIYAIIRDDGSYVLEPGGYCERCVLFFTEEEWNNLPPPDENDKNISHIKYDFTTNTWIDSRTIEDMKQQYFNLIYSIYNTLIDLTREYYTQITYRNNDSVLYLFVDEDEIDNTFYNNGSSNVLDMFKENISNSFKPRSYSKIKLDKKFLIEKYLEAKKYLEGQLDVWRQLPSLIDNSLYDLATISGWEKLIDKFKTYINDVYQYDEED